MSEIQHLNPFGLVIRTTQEKGRGVYATRGILPGTLIDVSPVLLFSKEDYDAYAKKTVIDDYAFVWGDGRMALVLGLGSIMNHSDTQPNVSYTLDKATLTIRFSTSRPIHPGDELCIYYGQKLWFSPAEKQGEQASDNPPSPEAVLPFGVGPDLLE